MTQAERKATCHPTRKHYARGLCASCHAIKHHKDNPEKAKRYHRTHYANVSKDPERVAKRAERKRLVSLMYRYGLTVEVYNEILSRQNGLCAVCRVQQAKYVDHSHSTGRVRGILCRNCNSGLGMLGDSPLVLRSAIEYLERNEL